MIFLLAVAAFAVEGALGFGATVLAASIGAQLVPLGELLPALVPVNLALSGWLVVRGRDAIVWPLLRALAPPLAIGAAFGIAAFHVLHAAWLARAFAMLVIALAACELARPKRRALSRTILVLGGVAHGMFGTGGPLVVYAIGRTLADPRAFRATLACVWLVLGVALAASYAASGLYSARTGVLTVILVGALVPGLALGELLHRRLARDRFARGVWLMLLVAGIALFVRG